MNDSPLPEVRFLIEHLPRTEETAQRKQVQLRVRGPSSQFLYLAMLIEFDSENSALSSSIRVHPRSKDRPPFFNWKLLPAKKEPRTGLIFFYIVSFYAFI